MFLWLTLGFARLTDLPSHRDDILMRWWQVLVSRTLPATVAAMTMDGSKWVRIIFLDAHRGRYKHVRGDRIESDDAAPSCPAEKVWLQEAANLGQKTAIPASRPSGCGNTGFGQRREETAQSQLEEQRAVDGSRVVSESEEQEQADASPDGDPTVEAGDAAGGDFEDRIPFGAVHSTPRVRMHGERGDKVHVEDVCLQRQDDEDHDEGQDEEPQEFLCGYIAPG